MAVHINLQRRTVTLAVGDLVGDPLQAVGRVGGLGIWARLQIGRDTHSDHQDTQTARHADYGREIVIRHTMAVDDFQVTIQGRIDGVIPPQPPNPTIIEEIKSVVLNPLSFASISSDTYPHYREQLELYCYLASQEKGLSPIHGRLTFINVPDKSEKQINVTGPFDECASLITTRIRALIELERRSQDEQQERRRAAKQMRFPHPAPRRHQDELMDAVRQSIEQGRHLLLEAPSGIGKTIGALQPAMLDALSQNRRVFFLTAKNTQHAHPLATLRAQQSPRAVSFHGREKMCIHTVYACHEEHCPFLQMFAQKLEQTNILGRLQKKRVVDATDLIMAGEQTRLCPFELALLVAETADAIVCDYNYVFDPQVHLRHLLQDDDTENTIVIIDEAHNLVDRARGYYSPMLSRRQVRELYPHLQFLEKTLARAFRQLLHRIEHCFDTLAMDGPDHEPRVLDEAAEEDAVTGTRVTELEFFERLKPELNRLAIRYLLDKTTSGRVIADDPVDAFLSQLGRLITVLGYRGDEFVRLFDPSHGGALRVVCLDASKQLAQRMNKFHTVIAMSATLGTLEFHQKMLGLDPHRTDRVRLPSPFPPENKVVRIVDNVLTTYRHRSRNYGKIARVIEATVDAHPGNYMALFPSYEFLDRVTDELATTSSLLIQRPRMSEHERANLLDALGQEGTHQLMLAVQGGIFAEGIDYPGELLSGVIVVSPALPQVTYERELMRRYYQNNYGRGFEFAYLYPGMNRVIQSVGRLIRTDSDRGVAVLVGRRFAEPQYQALFPHDWSQRPGDLRADDLAAELALFWRGTANATLAPPA